MEHYDAAIFLLCKRELLQSSQALTNELARCVPTIHESKMIATRQRMEFTRKKLKRKVRLLACLIKFSFVVIFWPLSHAPS